MQAVKSCVRALALRYRDPGLKTCFDQSLNLILVVPSFTFQLHFKIANWFAFDQLGFSSVVVVDVLLCCFVDCVSLALKNPHEEWPIIIKYVYICII